MATGPSIANVGALMGDPARSIMLCALMSGQALTARELAYVAGVAAATASGHLTQLLDGGLLAVEKQGRHRYYRLPGPEVASAIEALMNLA
jgi:DNA-binding transcriptional ArsR family regulator